MQSEYNLPSLAEILKSPESLKRAAENFSKFCDEQTKNTIENVEDNNTIKSAEDFLAILDGCGDKNDEFYKKNM